MESIVNNLGDMEQPEADKLPDHVIESINRGLNQAENGEVISLEEFREKYFNRK